MTEHSNTSTPWKRVFRRATIVAFVVVLLVWLFAPSPGGPDTPPASTEGGNLVSMEVTAYSDDPESTGWKRNWLGQPVYAYGPNEGKPKEVGITASGERAKRGTIAAHTDYYPFGTKMKVPGYGWGTVQDRGGAIKGANRIDLFFPTRREALEWGRQQCQVEVVPVTE